MPLSRSRPLWQRVKTKSWRGAKELRWLFSINPKCSPKVLFVVGAQRSGTTLLMRLFDADMRAQVYHEQSVLNRTDGDRLRLRPISEVNRILSRVRHPLVVAKPLVESQNIREILANVPGSKSLWVFRGFRDVVQSNVRRFGGQLKHLQPIVDRNTSDWRGERVSDQTHAFIAERFSEALPRQDAAALMWYARNILFFELELDQHLDVLACRYEDLVSQPRETFRGVYEFLGMREPTANFAEVHADSVGLGSGVEIDPEIERICLELESRISKSLMVSVE